MSFLDSFRDLSTGALLLRLFLAVFFGGLIGLNRTRKQRAAGFRTYMLVCVGAALTMMLGQYFVEMLHGPWQEMAQAANADIRADVTRISAMVMNGIGFLAAGTILMTHHQEVKGATTAAGLWASACMGIAIGAGFYESVIVSVILIGIAINILPFIENVMLERARNMNIFVEFRSINNLTGLISEIKARDIQIYDIDIEKHSGEMLAHPSAVIMMHMDRHAKKTTHATLISELASIDGVYSIKEVT